MHSHHPDASKFNREAETCQDFMIADMLAAVPSSVPNTYASVRDALIDAVVANGTAAKFSVPSACSLAHDVCKARAEFSALDDAASTLLYLVQQYDYNRRLDETNMAHVRASLAKCRAALALNTRAAR
jgi:hypothetical protein